MGANLQKVWSTRAQESQIGKGTSKNIKIRGEKEKTREKVTTWIGSAVTKRNKLNGAWTKKIKENLTALVVPTNHSEHGLKGLWKLGGNRYQTEK